MYPTTPYFIITSTLFRCTEHEFQLEMIALELTDKQQNLCIKKHFKGFKDIVLCSVYKADPNVLDLFLGVIGYFEYQCRQ
jgi:hypothetical protein